jgi:hypothetical protein
MNLWQKKTSKLGWSFINYQVGDASIISKPISAPKVVVMEENQDPNIGLAIVGSEKNMIHQFLWAYKDSFFLSIKNLGRL